MFLCEIMPFILGVAILVGMTAYFFVRADDADEKEFSQNSETFNRYFDLFKDKKQN